MYKINFTVEELSKFNTIERQKTKESLMSIYAYLLKLTKKKNDLYQNAGIDTDNTSLKISFRKFLTAYNRYHSKISLPTLKFYIDKLKELGLIAIQKVKNVFTYFFFRFGLNKKLNENLNTSQSTESIESSNVESNDEHLKYLNPKVNDLDSNSCTATKENTVKIDIENEEKITNWDYIDTLIKEAFKSLHVRSAWIKTEVIEKLFKYYRTITKRYAMSYIYKAIASARTRYYTNYNKYVKNNYCQNEAVQLKRKYSHEEIKDMERGLLGWQ